MRCCGPVHADTLMRGGASPYTQAPFGEGCAAGPVGCCVWCWLRGQCGQRVLLRRCTRLGLCWLLLACSRALVGILLWAIIFWRVSCTSLVYWPSHAPTPMHTPLPCSIPCNLWTTSAVRVQCRTATDGHVTACNATYWRQVRPPRTLRVNGRPGIRVKTTSSGRCGSALCTSCSEASGRQVCKSGCRTGSGSQGGWGRGVALILEP